jgi:hypothetical protein
MGLHENDGGGDRNPGEMTVTEPSDIGEQPKFERVVLLTKLRKGNLEKEGLVQKLQIVFLPELVVDNKEYDRKLSIEINKLMEGDTATHPISFRTGHTETVREIIIAMVTGYIQMGGNESALKDDLKNLGVI